MILTMYNNHEFMLHNLYRVLIMSNCERQILKLKTYNSILKPTQLKLICIHGRSDCGEIDISLIIISMKDKAPWDSEFLKRAFLFQFSQNNYDTLISNKRFEITTDAQSSHYPAKFLCTAFYTIHFPSAAHKHWL